MWTLPWSCNYPPQTTLLSLLSRNKKKKNHTVKSEFISRKRKGEKQGILKAPKQPHNSWARVRVSES